MKKVAMDWRLSREPADCDVLTITEYEELVASKTQFLQNQVSAAIDEIEKKQSELLAQIKLNPRNNASQKISIELKTGMEKFGFWVSLNNFSSFVDVDHTDDCLLVITRTNVERSSLALNLLQTVSETLRIHIAVKSGHSDKKTNRDKNLSGTYSLHSEINSRPVFKVIFNV